MSLVRSHGPKRGHALLQAVSVSPVTDFAAATLALAVALAVLSAVLPGADAAPVALALLSFLVVAALAGRAFQRHYPHDRLGLCNAITLGRLALTMALVAPLLSGAGASWAVFAVAVLALALDGVDGWSARRQGLSSAFGARFDMEVDSILALILALNAAVVSGAGVSAVLLGLPRYLFAAAAWCLPWMRRNLPERFSRKVVCVVQLGVLITLQAPILPHALAPVLVAAAGAALAWSFAVDLHWLWRRRA